MPQILGMKNLLRTFEKLERESKRKNNGDVIVGYSASYALRVHEDAKAEARRRLTKKGTAKNQQWKFLEQPARELKGEMTSIVKRAVKGGASLMKALLLAGLRLQRASQEIVPVDTGNLKASAFTEKE